LMSGGAFVGTIDEVLLTMIKPEHKRMTSDGYLLWGAYFFIFLGLSCSYMVQAGTMVIQDGHTSMALGKYLEYLEDPQGKVDLPLFLERKQQSELLKSEVDKPNFGYTKSTYWFVFELRNGSENMKNLLLEFDYPQLDSVEVYYFTDDQLNLKQELGDHQPFNVRPVDHRNFLLPISLGVQESLTMVIKIKTNSSFKVGLLLHDKDLFWQNEARETMIQGVYFGIMFVMFFYNAFIFLTLKTKTYFYYVIYVLMFAVYQFCQKGYDYQYLWQYAPFIHEKALPFSIGISGLGLIYFTRSFLVLDESSPRFSLAFKILGLGFIVGSVLTFFIPYVVSIKIQVFLTALSSLLMAVVAIYRVRKGCIDSRYYLLALFSFLFGSLLYALRTFGVLPSIFLTDYGAQIGSALEVILLSLALARRMKRLQEENTEIQKKAAEASKAAAADLARKNEEITFFNKNLERLVDEKTKEVRVLLDYIPQGVLSLENPEGKIAQDYSAHLEDIVGHSDISDTFFSEVILDRCQMSGDEKNQIQEIIKSIVGESELGFEINEGNLPRELVYLVDSQEKVLNVTWNV